MIIDCLSDLHGYTPTTPGGDLLIVAGDMTAMDTPKQWEKFYEWLKAQKYRKKIMIGGNHDNFLQSFMTTEASRALDAGIEYDHEYLCDNGCEFEGMKIWGSPWTIQFPNQNPEAMAFAVRTEFKLMDKFDSIPEDTNILITHSPPYGIGDMCSKGRVGSLALAHKVDSTPNLKLHVFGHIHEGYGVYDIDYKEVKYVCVNASYVDAKYKAAHKYIRVEL